MSQRFVPLTDIISPTDEYNTAVDDLYEQIEENDIPSWVLLPNRPAGEHATGHAWLGVVMAECSTATEDEQNVTEFDCRIAWDVEERHRRKSIVGEIPTPLIDTLHDAAKIIEDEIQSELEAQQEDEEEEEEEYSQNVDENGVVDYTYNSDDEEEEEEEDIFAEEIIQYTVRLTYNSETMKLTDIELGFTLEERLQN